MASINETGHVINVANFEDMISICTGFGTVYNPTKNSIKLAAMNTLFTGARNSLQAVKTAKTNFDNATNAREITFSGIKKLSTRIVNALAATDAAKQTVDDAKTVNRKIQGRRADNKTQPLPAATSGNTPVTPVPVQISVSQQSYDKLVDNFTKLIQVVSSEPLYIPNEADLKAAQLNTTLTNLKSSNTNVINAHTAFSNAIISRDATLYTDNTGLYDITGEVKKYVKSVFGASSPQFHQVSKIHFTNPR
jgi:chromosome segregation ATPase